MENGVKGIVLASLIRLFLSTAVNVQTVDLRTNKLFSSLSSDAPKYW